MEASYILLPLVDYNENAFNAELSELFPFCRVVNIDYHTQRFLIAFKDIEALLNDENAEKEVYEYDTKIEYFSRKHPYLDIAVIHVVGEDKNCFYDGYILKNRKKIKEYSGMHDAYVPIIKHFMPECRGVDLNIFTREFLNESI